MKWDGNFAAVHAYLCADGYVGKNSQNSKKRVYRITFTNTNLTLLKDFQKRFKEYFGIKPHLYEGKSCQIESKKIHEKITKEFGSFYSWEWIAPSLNKNLSKIWLRAYFDCDGWVICKSHQNRQIGAECVNQKGIKQVQNMLKTLKIDSKIKKRSTRNIFSLKIYGKENILRFKEAIGFLHPMKKEKLKEATEDFVNYYWKFPEDNKKWKIFIKNVIQERGRVKKGNKIVRIISNKKENLSILSDKLKELFDVESRLNKMVNGIGTFYYELSINKREEIKKLIRNNLLNNFERKKWLK